MNFKRWIFVGIIILVAFFAIMIIFNVCPPKGFPQPPTCSVSSVRDDFGCFPPSCSMIPKGGVQEMCNDWRSGKDIDWGTMDCETAKGITENCKKLCQNTTITKYLQSEIPIYGRDFYKDPKDLPLTGTIYPFGPSLATNTFWITLPLKRGANAYSGISVWNEDAWKTIDDVPEELKGAYVKDIDGNVAYVQKVVFLNILDPAYFSWIKKKIDEHIAAGTNGFTFDEHWGTSAAVDMGIGPFDDYALSGFREHLRSKYSAEELKEKGITDINTFNYKDFIIRNGYKEAYISGGNVPLRDEYKIYLLGAGAKVLNNIIDYIKQKDSSLGIGANVDPFYNVEDFGSFYSKLNVYIFEHEWFPEWRSMRDYKVIPAGHPVSPNLKYAYSLSKDAGVMFGGNDGRVLTPMNKDAATGLILHQFAEVYANRGYYMYFELTDYLGMNFHANKERLYPYYLFVRAHPEAFRVLQQENAVAVMRPPHSKQSLTESLDRVNGLSIALQVANIEHDVVDLDKIRDYKLVIATGFAWSDADISKLMDFVRAGGTAIVSEDRFGTMDEQYSEKTRADLEALKVPGAHALGAGKFIFVGNDAGMKAFQYYDPASEIINDAAKVAPANSAPKDVEVIVYKSADTMVAHILNYNFRSGDFAEKDNLKLRLRVPEGISGKSLKLISPDLRGEEALEFTENNGWIEVTVPKLKIWDVLILS